MTESDYWKNTNRVKRIVRVKGIDMDILFEILQELHPDIDFKTHKTLIDDQVIDSFDIVTLVAEVNDRIGVAIPAEELIPENFNSYAGLKDLVDKLENM